MRPAPRAVPPPGAPPRFLLTDAEQRSTLAAARAIAGYGYEVAAAGSDRGSLAHLSRACSKRLIVPRPDKEPDAFVDAIQQILEHHSYAGVITATEASLLALSAGRERIERLVRLGLPPHEVVVRTLDKTAFAEAAAAAGAPGPAGIVCDSIAEGMHALREVGFPAVVKPATSLVRTDDAVWRQEARIVGSESEFMRTHRRFGSRFIVQQLLPEATIWSCSGLAVDGRLRALTPVRYIRTWPPRAGSASYAETVPPFDTMPQRVEAVLNAIGWQGLFELEFLESGPDVYTLDLNPRLHGWFTLSLHAGADPLRPWCEWLLNGEVPPELVVATPGVKYSWEEGELGTMLWNLRHGRLRAALAVARPQRGVVYAISDASDPGPLAAWALAFVRRALRRLWRR
jgi:predicted ATP-grasp superfamily ATP-dependent carboligase